MAQNKFGNYKIAPQREITNHWSGLKSDILVTKERYFCRSIKPLCLTDTLVKVVYCQPSLSKQKLSASLMSSDRL
ncbi:MAG: hypothetical protein ACK45T_08245, partial [Pseudanabaena sp.]